MGDAVLGHGLRWVGAGVSGRSPPRGGRVMKTSCEMKITVGLVGKPEELTKFMTRGQQI